MVGRCGVEGVECRGWRTEPATARKWGVAYRWSRRTQVEGSGMACWYRCGLWVGALLRVLRIMKSSRHGTAWCAAGNAGRKEVEVVESRAVHAEAAGRLKWSTLARGVGW